MMVIREQLIEAAKTYTDFKSKYNISAFNEKTNFFGLSFLLFFETADLRSYCGYFLAICQLCLIFFLFVDFVGWLLNFWLILGAVFQIFELLKSIAHASLSQFTSEVKSKVRRIIFYSILII